MYQRSPRHGDENDKTDAVLFDWSSFDYFNRCGFLMESSQQKELIVKFFCITV